MNLVELNQDEISSIGGGNIIDRIGKALHDAWHWMEDHLQVGNDVSHSS